MNRAVNDGVLDGFARGVLTSTSVLANAPDVSSALGRWKDLEADRAAGNLPSTAWRRRLDDPAEPFDLGVHLNLTQGRPLTAGRYPPELLDAEGRFPGIFGLYRRLCGGRRRFAAAIQDELACQIQVLLDHGQVPSHLNGHQYAELIPTVSGAVAAVVGRFRVRSVRVALERAWTAALGWPGISTTRWLIAGVQRMYAWRFRRRMERLGVACSAAYFGTLTAGTVDRGILGTYLTAAERFPLVEVALHPARNPAAEAVPLTGDAAGWYDPLASWRPRELELLVSTELVAQLEQLHLRLGRLRQ